MTALTIAIALSPIVDAYSVGREIVQTTVNAMDAAEKLKNSTLSGDEKRNWVIEYAKKEIKNVFNNLDYWIPLIIRFINAVKTAFKALKAVF